MAFVVVVQRVIYGDDIYEIDYVWVYATCDDNGVLLILSYGRASDS